MPRTGTPPESNEYAELGLSSGRPQCAVERCGEMRRRARMNRGSSDMRPEALRYRTFSVDARTARIHSLRDFGRASADVKGWRWGTRQPSTRLSKGAISADVVAQTVPDHRFAIGLSRS